MEFCIEAEIRISGVTLWLLLECNKTLIECNKTFLKKQFFCHFS